MPPCPPTMADCTLSLTKTNPLSPKQTNKLIKDKSRCWAQFPNELIRSMYHFKNIFLFYKNTNYKSNHWDSCITNYHDHIVKHPQSYGAWSRCIGVTGQPDMGLWWGWKRWNNITSWLKMCHWKNKPPHHNTMVE